MDGGLNNFGVEVALDTCAQGACVPYPVWPRGILGIITGEADPGSC